MVPLRRPCTPAPSGLRHAALFRGQPYRAGCSVSAMDYQMDILRLWQRRLLEPLELGGHCVDVLLSLSSGGGGCNRSLLAAAHGDRLRAVRRVRSPSQAAGVRSGLDLFVGAGGRSVYDVLVLTRHDVYPYHPIGSWPCSFGRGEISFSGTCVEAEWRRSECVADTMIVVGRHRMRAFFAHVGAAGSQQPVARAVKQRSDDGDDDDDDDGYSNCGCFDPACKGAHGHNCLTSLVAARVARREDVGLCSPGHGGDWFAIGAKCLIPGVTRGVTGVALPDEGPRGRQRALLDCQRRHGFG